jgi:hypothetical protein
MKLSTKEIALKHGVSERTARRWRASGHWRANDDRVSAVSEPRKDQDPEELLSRLYKELAEARQTLVTIKHMTLYPFGRAKDVANMTELTKLVSETKADMEDAEKHLAHAYCRIITRCRKFGWRPAALGELHPLDPASAEWLPK